MGTVAVTIGILAELADVKTIPAIEALKFVGLTLAEAKKAVEDVIDTGHRQIDIPDFAFDGLRDDLRRKGFDLMRITATDETTSVR